VGRWGGGRVGGWEGGRHTCPANPKRPSKFLPKLLQSNTLNHHICKARPDPENYLYSGTKCKVTAPIENRVALPPGFANPRNRHPISMHPDWNGTPPPVLTSPQGSVALPNKLFHCMCVSFYKIVWLWQCTGIHMTWWMTWVGEDA
jgi:hypothetical protein